MSGSLRSSPFSELPAYGYIRQSRLIPNVVPISPATLWRKVAAGTFPRPVKLSERVTAWRIEDVRAWLADPLGFTVRQEGGHDDEA